MTNANAWYQQQGQPRRLSEKQEQAAIVQLLESLGAKVYVIGTRRPKGDHPGTCMTPGIPDLYAVLPLRSAPLHYRGLWIEVKAANGRVSLAQMAFAEMAQNTIGIVYIRGTSDAVQNWLVDHGWLKADQRRSA